MNKPQNRFNIFHLMNTVRLRVEEKLAAALNAACRETYKGEYDVMLTNPSKVTNKVLSRLCTTGVVKFYPEDETQYASLKDYREADGGINLSTLLGVKDRPEHILEDEWASHHVMLKHVFSVLRKQGIIPMQILVADAQRAFCYNVPKISKNFGGDCDDEAYSEPTLNEVMETLIDKLDALPVAA